MRRSTICVVLLTAGIGFGLFKLKYEVMTLKQSYRQINQQISQAQESISVLKAEWAHLTNPDRLARLSSRYLTVAPVSGAQFVSLDQVVGGEHNYDRMALEQLVADVTSDINFDDSPEE